MAKRFDKKNAIRMGGSMMPDLNGTSHRNPYSSLDTDYFKPVYQGDVAKHKEEKREKELARLREIEETERQQAELKRKQLEEEIAAAEQAKRDAEDREIEAKHKRDAELQAEYFAYLEFSSLSPKNVERIKGLSTIDISDEGIDRKSENQPDPPPNQMWSVKKAELRRRLGLSDVKCVHRGCKHSYSATTLHGHSRHIQEIREKELVELQRKLTEQIRANDSEGQRLKKRAQMDYSTDYEGGYEPGKGWKRVPEEVAIKRMIDADVEYDRKNFKLSASSCRICSKIRQLAEKDVGKFWVNQYKLAGHNFDWLIKQLDKDPENPFGSDEYEMDCDYDGISWEREVSKYTEKRLATKEAFYRALYMERCPLRFDEWYDVVKKGVTPETIVARRNAGTYGRGYQVKLNDIHFPGGRPDVNQPRKPKPAAAGP